MTIDSIMCEYCNREFTQNRNLRQHYERCKKKEACLLQMNIQTLTNEMRIQHDQLCKQHECEIQHLKEQFQSQLQTQRSQHEREIQTQRDIVGLLEKKIEKLENQIFEIAKQPSHIHNTNNQKTLNIINQLAPYDLTKERVIQIVKEGFTEEVFHGGPDKICEFTVKALLTNTEFQKPKTICTDSSRLNFKFINPETQEVEVDPGFQKTHSLLCDPLVKANLSVLTSKSEQTEQLRDAWKANDEFIENRTQFTQRLLRQFAM